MYVLRRGGLVSQRASAILLLAACAAPSAVSGCSFPDYEVERIQIVPGGQATGATSNNAEAGTPVKGGSAGSGASAGNGGAPTGGVSGDSGSGGDAGSLIRAGAPDAQGGAGGSPSDGPLLFDDFEDGTDDGWFATSGDWQVVLNGQNHAYQVKTLLDASLFSVIGDLTWSDVAVEAKVHILEFGGVSSADLVGVFARFESPASHYYVALRADGKLALRKKVQTNVTLGNPIDLGIAAGKDYLVRFELQRGELRAYLNNVMVLSTQDDELKMGRIAVGTDNARATFDDVTVTAL